MFHQTMQKEALLKFYLFYMKAQLITGFQVFFLAGWYEEFYMIAIVSEPY